MATTPSSRVVSASNGKVDAFTPTLALDNLAGVFPKTFSCVYALSRQCSDFAIEHSIPNIQQTEGKIEGSSWDDQRQHLLGGTSRGRKRRLDPRLMTLRAPPPRGVVASDRGGPRKWCDRRARCS